MSTDSVCRHAPCTGHAQLFLKRDIDVRCGYSTRHLAPSASRAKRSLKIAPSITDDDHPVDFRFLEINPIFEEQTGLVDAEGRTARELVPDLDVFWFDVYGEVALSGKPARFEHHDRDRASNEYLNAASCSSPTISTSPSPSPRCSSSRVTRPSSLPLRLPPGSTDVSFPPLARRIRSRYVG